MQADLQHLFPDAVPLAPGVPPPWPDIPARGALYLLVTTEAGEEKPLLLATVGDLRAALKRRLEEPPPDLKSRRIDYAQLCTRLYWRRVDSSFAANVWYARAARSLFPATAAALIPWRTSWWIAVERGIPFPRMRRTSDLRDPDFDYAGPIRDKHAAERLIETVIDLFDLCRYHAILLQSPHGKACAYKEMGKCPAPCDGSVPADWYAGQMCRAWSFLTGETRGTWKQELEAHMRAAAGRLEFETAARLKKQLARAGALEGRAGDATARVRPLDDFSFLSLQPGKSNTWLEPWVIHGAHIESLPQIQKKTLAAELPAVYERFFTLTRTPLRDSLSDDAAMESIALTAHHLFRGEDDHGLWIPTRDLFLQGPPAIADAATRLLARKTPPKPLAEVSSEKPLEAPAESQPSMPEPPSATPSDTRASSQAP